jgi:hypothetical protein
MHPGQLFFRINIFCRRKIFRLIEAGGGDVDLIRPAIGFVGQRRAARIAERSKRAGVSFVSMRFSGFPFEFRTLHHCPRHGLRAGGSAAVFTMTVRGHARLSVYRESNFPAVATAGDHRSFHYAKDSKNRAKDCRLDDTRSTTCLKLTGDGAARNKNRGLRIS